MAGKPEGQSTDTESISYSFGDTPFCDTRFLVTFDKRRSLASPNGTTRLGAAAFPHTHVPANSQFHRILSNRSRLRVATQPMTAFIVTGQSKSPNRELSRSDRGSTGLEAAAQASRSNLPEANTATQGSHCDFWPSPIHGPSIAFLLNSPNTIIGKSHSNRPPDVLASKFALKLALSESMISPK